MTKNVNPEHLFCLSDRALINISGVDAENFLQGLVTNDIRRATDGKIIYSCLLTPQGQFLYDFFILQDVAGGYLLDCAQEAAEGLKKHLGIFKLRAKIDIQNITERYHLYFSIGNDPGHLSFADPRHPGLGYRIYADKKMPDAKSAEGYHDFCIGQGVASRPSSFKPGKDFPSDLNLDVLGALNWDKGCFTGQEVVARIRYRGLVKRRLFIVEGKNLKPGTAVFQGGIEVGEIRQVNDSQDQGLAVIKLDAVTERKEEILTSHEGQIGVITPYYLAV